MQLIMKDLQKLFDEMKPRKEIDIIVSAIQQMRENFLKNQQPDSIKPKYFF